MKPSMKPETFLLASTLLCTLLGLGYPLDCWVCISPGPFCQGTMQACAPEEDTCMAAIYETHRAFRRNLTENGLRCPSCFAFLKETCTPTQEALCVGEETRCVTMTGLMHPGIRFAAQGCGTENTCHSKPGTLVPSGSRLLTIKKTSCLKPPGFWQG
ncbi:phospholipase A2 inhibitor and Ly6/PLAUR domain-containing protein-like [Odocoileus virginianus]|uniref:Phospholipase A2 inhibitor and Ly6/PLAUR domain-containing protein-like n=1 Tax=Odocoileus virginianus TaxID=9874 RepID=A0ABM4GXF2_ODOVR